MNDSIFTPEPLRYYLNQTAGAQATVNLNQEQAAVVLKAHDWGIKRLNHTESALLDQVMSEIKMQIHP